MQGSNPLLSALLVVLALGGCQEAGDNVAEENLEGEAARPEPLAAEPSGIHQPAPISFDYAVIGSPLVGQPVSINLEVASTVTDRPVTLHYRINDPRNLAFPASQAQSVLLPAGGTGPVTQQVTVVPQREGRLYLNVSAEVETDGGALVKSMAIPIQVGTPPPQQADVAPGSDDADD